LYPYPYLYLDTVENIDDEIDEDTDSRAGCFRVDHATAAGGSSTRRASPSG